MTKEELDKIMQIKGNVRGAIFQTHAVYIRLKKGDEGVKMVEEKLKELGHPLKFEEVKPLDWYPEAISILIMVVIKEIFNWTDKDIFEMGNMAPKSSFIVRLVIKHFLTPQKCFERGNDHWKKNTDWGEMEAYEFNEKEKYAILRMHGCKSHPVVCFYHGGYFLRIAQFVLRSEKVTVEETKCTHRGDPYDEYIIRWE
ncbi:MAG: hypothetical protein A2812_02195 [Candidatus Staskawiczbacteria bacterium RIFCSPHIGHO2_01_FULL_36_16]|uniref:4-vinyl reductase 4VR domain-containing protein n=1 Tax=Candidatus Staskawiczbacteria bacterium RIFCSPHIGHO2_01_FULL_36_16 TaxID=1802200 RepID=A0A1G2HNJ9_9BACT|nr:MAG: hypothetical protein A2812_02195 [Candidatus Staskawiczbacteria bacterium RIFCSPHIGHO2_01_FULL_36_16]